MIDVSSAAITRRLNQAEQLRKLRVTLMNAKPINDEVAVELKSNFCKRESLDARPCRS